MSEALDQHRRHGRATESSEGAFLTDSGILVLEKMRWRTPSEVVSDAARRLGLPEDRFDLDAAGEQGASHGRRVITAEDDALTIPWATHGCAAGEVNRSAFLNSPWAAKGISLEMRRAAEKLFPGRDIAPFPGTAAFVEAAWRASRAGLTTFVLLPQALESAWQKSAVRRADEVWIAGRLRFLDVSGEQGCNPPGGHLALVFRPHVPPAGWPGGPRVDWSWSPGTTSRRSR